MLKTPSVLTFRKGEMSKAYSGGWNEAYKTTLSREWEKELSKRGIISLKMIGCL